MSQQSLVRKETTVGISTATSGDDKEMERSTRTFQNECLPVGAAGRQFVLAARRQRRRLRLARGGRHGGGADDVLWRKAGRLQRHQAALHGVVVVGRVRRTRPCQEPPRNQKKQISQVDPPINP